MEINITKSLESFHDKITRESKVVLSARFGDGKTYFLNEFREKYNKEFSFFTVYPVNYSVAENADIFEYIKRDILVQLMQQEVIDDTSINLDTFTHALFNKDTAKELVHFLLECFPASAITKKLADKVFGVYHDYKKEEHSAAKYVSSFQNGKGLYEMDAYSLLITKILGTIKNKKVLIIEDLDRLDPAHLFRILNVLAAHIDNPEYDAQTNSNKFGFDTIIIVMDYETSAHLFHHFYGDNANYEGYMQKFTNGVPFRYSITELARQELISMLKEHIDIDIVDLKIISTTWLKGNTEKENAGEKINKLSVRRIAEIIKNKDNWYKKPQDVQYANILFLVSFLRQIGLCDGDPLAICRCFTEWDASFQSICTIFFPIYASVNGRSSVYELSNNPMIASYIKGKISFKAYQGGDNTYSTRYNRGDILKSFTDSLRNKIADMVII